MEAVARLRNNPRSNNNSGSPRKARLVIDTIRGTDVETALNRLRYSHKAVSTTIEKLVRSAINNWEQKNDADATEHELYIKEAFVDAGVTLKRFQPAPHGRAHRIRKRTNHMTIVVDSREPLEYDMDYEEPEMEEEENDTVEENQEEI